ncbi:hypothetical protein ACH5RR_019568, partial [Cinchona calisaya]
MDVPTRRNSTFLMLDSALPLKEAFGRLEQIDRNYKLNPSEDEWKVAYIVHDCLKKIYDATNRFSGFKLALVEYNYNAIYGENAKKYVDRVRSAIVDLFVEYGGELNPSFGYACGSDVEESNFSGANKESDDISDDMFSNFDK